VHLLLDLVLLGRPGRHAGCGSPVRYMIATFGHSPRRLFRGANSNDVQGTFFAALRALQESPQTCCGTRATEGDGCEAEVSDGYGQTVTVRKGEVETIEHNRDRTRVTVTSQEERSRQHLDFRCAPLPMPWARR